MNQNLKRKISVVDYICYDNLSGSLSVLQKYGFPPAKDYSQVSNGLSKIISKYGAAGLQDVMSAHPDKDVLLELFAPPAPAPEVTTVKQEKIMSNMDADDLNFCPCGFDAVNTSDDSNMRWSKNDKWMLKQERIMSNADGGAASCATSGGRNKKRCMARMGGEFGYGADASTSATPAPAPAAADTTSISNMGVVLVGGVLAIVLAVVVLNKIA